MEIVWQSRQPIWTILQSKNPSITHILPTQVMNLLTAFATGKLLQQERMLVFCLIYGTENYSQPAVIYQSRQ